MTIATLSETCSEATKEISEGLEHLQKASTLLKKLMQSNVTLSGSSHLSPGIVNGLRAVIGTSEELVSRNTALLDMAMSALTVLTIPGLCDGAQTQESETRPTPRETSRRSCDHCGQFPPFHLEGCPSRQ